MSEAPVVKRVMMQASKLKMRLLRNNRGMFYTMDKKRIVRAGLEADGASDLIGGTPVTITPEMVGMQILIATVAEVKEPTWTKPQNDHERIQENFINQVIKRGGIGFFITNHEDLENKVKDCLKNMIDRHLNKA